MIRRFLATMLALLALTLVTVACDGGDDDTDDGAAATTTEATDDGADTGDDAAGGGASVTAVDISFQPSTVEVPAGSTVTWTNEDTVAHTVTAGEPGEPADTFDESLPAGETAEVTFDEAGTFAYFCQIHPSMTAEVVVS